jgi:hypothetical protein
MEVSKLQLSHKELEVVQDAQIILTKNSIIHKAINLLQQLQQSMQQATVAEADHIFSVPPKISKGEQYIGLPYVILDFPRIASGNNICFIRSMFWWGHYFSSTLHISGTYQKVDVIKHSYLQLGAADYFVGVNDDPWQHHFEPDNYRKISELSIEEFAVQLQKYPHTKIAAKWPLTEWNIAAIHLLESWKLLCGLIT